MTHSLTLGSLLLTEPEGAPPVADEGYRFAVLAEGTTFGVAKGVQQVVRSMLGDGDIVRIDRYGNREVSFSVELSGPTLGALALGEAALRNELGRPNTLTWQAPDVMAEPTVFEVVTSEMSQTFKDLDELNRTREFVVTLICAPFVRPVDPITVAGVPLGTYSPTSVDTCDSATDWSALVNGASTTPTVSSGAIYATDATSPYEVALTRTGSVNFASTPYLVIEAAGTSTVTADAGSGTTPFPVVSDRLLASGFRQIVFNTGGITVSALRWVATRGKDALTFGIANVERAATPPQVSTRQITNVVEVRGTERTPASLSVAAADGTTDLGMTIVHTSPEDGSGYAPPLRRWRIAGADSPTTDATMMSGVREPYTVAKPFIAEVPNKALPEGGYLLAARARASAPGSFAINWGAETRINGAAAGNVGDFASITFPNTGWFFVPIAVLSLPTVRSAAGSVRISLSCSTGELDEAWVYRIDDDCALSVIHNAQAARLWLDSPDVTAGVPRIWIGDAADRSDAFHPGDNLHTHGNHTFRPAAMRVFAATAAASPDVSLSYYPRSPYNVAS